MILFQQLGIKFSKRLHHHMFKIRLNSNKYNKQDWNKIILDIAFCLQLHHAGILLSATYIILL